MRTDYSIKNSTVSFISNLIIAFVLFVSRTIFIKMLGAEYLGLNGLFENFLMLLNFFELGIGNAIVFNLYKPINDCNNEKIMSLVLFYKKIYNLIMIGIFFIGLIFVPFLKIIVGSITVDVNIYLVYFLFLISTLITYFISYKRSLIIANQRSYVITIIHTFYYIVVNFFQLLVIYFTKNYYLYLATNILCQLLENIVISVKANIDYPYLVRNNAKKLDDNTKKDIFNRVKALIYHKFGTIIIYGTDNVIISLFFGIITVGICANYSYIFNNVSNLFGEIISTSTASVGNLLINNDYSQNFSVFKRVRFLNYWISVFTACCLFILIQPFIQLWIGDEYILNTSVVLILVINYYQKIMRNTYNTFKDSAGIWVEDKYVPLIEAFSNIFFSIILLKFIGVAGVFLGTIMSSLVLWCYSYPKYVYKKLFNRSYKRYMFETAMYSFLFIIIISIVYVLSNLFVFNSVIFNFIVNLIISVIIPNLILYIVFRKSDNFHYFCSLIHIYFKKNN